MGTALVLIDHFAMYRKVWKRLLETARLCCGVPDYERYIRHMQEHHPEREPMDYKAFFRERQNARFGGRGGGFRCC